MNTRQKRQDSQLAKTNQNRHEAKKKKRLPKRLLCPKATSSRFLAQRNGLPATCDFLGMPKRNVAANRHAGQPCLKNRSLFGAEIHLRCLPLLPIPYSARPRLRSKLKAAAASKKREASQPATFTQSMCSHSSVSLPERKSTQHCLHVECEFATPAPAFGIVFRLPIFLFLHLIYSRAQVGVKWSLPHSSSAVSSRVVVLTDPDPTPPPDMPA